MTKESVYGWYPSVRNIYENAAAVKGHEREALFRYYQQHMNRAAPATPEPWNTSQPGTPASQLGTGLTVKKVPISPRASVRGSSSKAAYRAQSAPSTKPTSKPASATRAITNINSNSGKVPVRVSSGANRAKSATTTRIASAATKAKADSCAVNVGTTRPKSAMSTPSQASVRPSLAPSPYTQARNAYAQRFVCTQEIPAERPDTAKEFEVPFAQPMRNIPTPSLSNYEFNVVTPKPTIDFRIDTPEPLPHPEVVEIPKVTSPAVSEVASVEVKELVDERTPEPVAASPVPSVQQGVKSASSKSSRVQSATTRRERSAVPPRPVRSACGQRTPSSISQASIPSPAPSKAASSPAINIIPCKEVDSSTLDMRSYTKQYEEIVKKYGWRAQVHGNPLKLKKVMPRLSYAVKCDEPTLPPEPPRFHWQNYDTYFQNTIPHQPMSFTIHPHFVSETLNAKRMELQKREGIKYRYKDYAFHY